MFSNSNQRKFNQSECFVGRCFLSWNFLAAKINDIIYYCSGFSIAFGILAFFTIQCAIQYCIDICHPILDRSKLAFGFYRVNSTTSSNNNINMTDLTSSSSSYSTASLPRSEEISNASHAAVDKVEALAKTEGEHFEELRKKFTN